MGAIVVEGIHDTGARGIGGGGRKIRAGIGRILGGIAFMARPNGYSTQEKEKQGKFFHKKAYYLFLTLR
jgi:hypothetical protein